MSEIRFLLTREAPRAEHTFGELAVDDARRERICWTMEPGTNDRDFPRVPTGFYALIPHVSAQAWIGATFALVGQNVSHYPQPGVDRHAILIHAGNDDDDTKGCIIPGLRRGRLGEEHAVLASREAVGILLDRIRSADRAFLTIR